MLLLTALIRALGAFGAEAPFASFEVSHLGTFLGRATPDARERIPTIATTSPTQIIKPREAASPKRCLYDRVAAPIRAALSN